MIKVIREGTRNKIECDYCGALLSYDKEDIQQKEQYWGPHGYSNYNIIKYILCPQCKNEIVMEGTR